MSTTTDLPAAMERLRIHFESLHREYIEEDHDDPSLRQYIDDGLDVLASLTLTPAEVAVIERLRWLHEKATPGPWKWYETDQGESRINPDAGGLLVARCDVRNPFSEQQRDNAASIVETHNALPVLLGIVDRLTGK